MELRPRKARPPPATSTKSRKPSSSQKTPPFSASEKVSSKTRPFHESNIHPNTGVEFVEEKSVAEPSDVYNLSELKNRTIERHGSVRGANGESSIKKKINDVRDRSSLQAQTKSCEDEKEGKMAFGMKIKKNKKKDETSRILFPDENEDTEALGMIDAGIQGHSLVLSPSDVMNTRDGMGANLCNLGGSDKITEAQKKEERKCLAHTSDIIEMELKELKVTSDTIEDGTCHIEEHPAEVDGLRTPITCKQSDVDISSKDKTKIQYTKSSMKKKKKKKFVESEVLCASAHKFEDQSMVVDAYPACIEHNTLQYSKKSAKTKENVTVLGEYIDAEKKPVNDDTRLNGFDELKASVKNNLSDDQHMHDTNVIERASSPQQSNDINEEDMIRKGEYLALHGATLMETTLSPTGNQGEKDLMNKGDEDDESSSDEYGDVEEMAKYFVKSMKEYMEQTELSVQSTPQREDEEKTKSLKDEKSVSFKLDTGCSRSSGLGSIWRPETGFSSSMNMKANDAKSLGKVVAASIWKKEGKLQDGLVMPPIDPSKRNKLVRKQKDNTAGAKWFNLSAPTITPELKKELQVLKLRGVIDPKRHYKADDSKGLPKYFEVGTIIGGPTDFYSGRLTKKERKSSLADELLADSSVTAYRKRKYSEIQEQKKAGGKAFWKKTKGKRMPAWAKI